MEWPVIISVIFGCAICFLLGMNYGVYRDRKWRRQQEQDEQKLRYYEERVAEIQRDYKDRTLEWYDRIN